MTIVKHLDIAIQNLAASAPGGNKNPQLFTIHESVNKIYFQITSNNLEIYQIYCNHFKKLIFLNFGNLIVLVSSVVTTLLGTTMRNGSVFLKEILGIIL